MEFTKMHGLGNDFIVINNLQNYDLDWPDIAVKLCHRNRGIGADGLILVNKGDKADYKMVLYNSDGSLGKMCGNGIRCFAKYLYDKGFIDKLEFSVDTDSGLKKLYLTVEKREVVSVVVDMGPPIMDPESIPLKAADNRNQRIEVAGREFNFTSISMGNPHTVIFLEEDLQSFPLKKYGPLIENHPFFPEQTNVEFVILDANGNLNMRVWEKGVGETQACGTGACATFVAAVLEEKVNLTTGHVNLLGGVLKITWDGNVFMEGPAVTVFEGQVAL